MVSAAEGEQQSLLAVLQGAHDEAQEQSDAFAQDAGGLHAERAVAEAAPRPRARWPWRRTRSGREGSRRSRLRRWKTDRADVVREPHSGERADDAADESDERDLETEAAWQPSRACAPMACMMAISPRRSIMVVAVRLQTVRPAESSATSVMRPIRPPTLIENFAFRIGHFANRPRLRAGQSLLDLVGDRRDVVGATPALVALSAVMVFGSLRAKSSSGLVSAATSMRSTCAGASGELLQACERDENAVVGFFAGRENADDAERRSEQRDLAAGLPAVASRHARADDALVEDVGSPASLHDLPGGIDGFDAGGLRVGRRASYKDAENQTPWTCSAPSCAVERRARSRVMFRPQKIFLMFGTSDSGM